MKKFLKSVAIAALLVMGLSGCNASMLNFLDLPIKGGPPTEDGYWTDAVGVEAWLAEDENCDGNIVVISLNDTQSWQLAQDQVTLNFGFRITWDDGTVRTGSNPITGRCFSYDVDVAIAEISIWAGKSGGLASLNVFLGGDDPHCVVTPGPTEGK